MLTIAEIYKLFTSCKGVSTDTRKMEEKFLFFALKGNRFDANDFAEKALELGASYVVIDNPTYNTSSQMILVEDTLKTLQALAKYHREILQTQIIAITGSNGKTTTKELILSVLSKKYNTIATQGNLNNHIGVPLTLLNSKPETEILVVEMGANHLKEIAFLCQIASPNYGYITNFGKAHLEGFGGEIGVITGKSELYTHLKSQDQKIFYNAEDPLQKEILKTYPNKFGFSFSNSADISVMPLPSKEFATVGFNGRTIHSKLVGNYNISNIAAAITVGSYFHISTEDIKEAIENYEPSNNRSQIIQKGTIKIIADAYNANPSSMRAALLSFSKKQEDKLAILGDMFELGKSSKQEHQDIADFAKKLSIEAILVGEVFSQISTDFKTFRTVDNLINFLEKQPIYRSKTFLIKASRGMALECLFNTLFRE